MTDSNKSSKKSDKLMKNFVMMFAGNFVSKILSFFMVPFYTSILTTSDYGTADLINTTVFLILPIFSLLIDEAVVRFTLDKDSDKKRVFSISLFISTIGFLIMLCISPIFLLFGVFKPYYGFILLYYIVSWLYNITSNFAKGMECIFNITVSGIIHTFSYLILNILFLSIIPLGVRGYLFAINISNIITIIYLFFSCGMFRYITNVKKQDWNLGVQMSKYSIPMIPNYISWWINNVLDRYILNFFCGTSITGIYSIAYKIPSLITSAVTIFSSAWKISSVEDFGTESSIEFYQKTYRVYHGILFISASGLILFTQPLAKILYSNEFYLAWQITPILILACVYSTLAQFIGSIFVAAKVTEKLFVSSGVGAIANTILNFILIPFYGGTGAAIATVLSYAIIWLVNIYNAKKIMQIKYISLRIVVSTILIIAEIIAIIVNGLLGYVLAIVCTIIIMILNKDACIKMLYMILEKIRKIVIRREGRRK